jgi:hypothetical protein
MKMTSYNNMKRERDRGRRRGSISQAPFILSGSGR